MITEAVVFYCETENKICLAATPATDTSAPSRRKQTARPALHGKRTATHRDLDSTVRTKKCPKGAHLCPSEGEPLPARQRTFVRSGAGLCPCGG